MFNHFGTVYILENPTSNRVKVGLTGIGRNDPDGRLKDVNDKWLSIKATCQICGSRRKVTRERLIPEHVTNGRICYGGMRLPFEKETELARNHLNELNVQLSSLSGTAKGSVTRQINSLEKRLRIFSNYEQPRGLWYINTLYRTKCAEVVEKKAHERLSKCLDHSAPFGEVFQCSVAHARLAIEGILDEMEIDDVSKETGFAYTSFDFGQCPICDNNLTKAGICPNCTQIRLDNS
jgi:hypothetical protein